MNDGTFLSRAWPSILALVGTVAVVLGLLFVFGGGSGDDPSAGDQADSDGAGVTDAPTVPPQTEQPSGDDSDGQDPVEEATEEPQVPATPVDAPPELRTQLGILNSTDITGLASGAQERFQAGGWEVPVVTNYSGQVDGTTAYYPNADLQASAEALQAQFPEIRFVEPTPPGSNLTTDRILVILAQDYADATEAAGESG